MALVKESYFVGIIDIDTSRQDVKENIVIFSDYCEKTYLKMLLGNNLYYDYAANKTASKWVNFLAAGNFTSGGQTYRNDVKQMLAYFCYFEMARNNQSYNTPGAGEVQLATQNATPVQMSFKLNMAWNEAVDLYEVANIYLAENDSLFEDLETQKLNYINLFGI